MHEESYRRTNIAYNATHVAKYTFILSTLCAYELLLLYGAARLASARRRIDTYYYITFSCTRSG